MLSRQPYDFVVFPTALLRDRNVLQVAVAIDPHLSPVDGGLLGIDLPPQLSRAVDKRRREFLAGRFCAREALSQLSSGLGDAPLVIGDRGAPVWPSDVVGSITHTRRFAAAAVAWLAEVPGVGIDTEEMLTAERASSIASQIVRPSELEALRGRGLSDNALVTLLFSAKESLYKAYFSRVGRVWGFHDVIVTDVDLAAHRFRAHFAVELSERVGAGLEVMGRLEVNRDYVHTAVVVDDYASARPSTLPALVVESRSVSSSSHLGHRHKAALEGIGVRGAAGAFEVVAAHAAGAGGEGGVKGGA